jgi:hypothetical protein
MVQFACSDVAPNLICDEIDSLSPGGTPCKIFGSNVSRELWVQYWLVLGVGQRPHCYNVWKIIMAFAAVCWSLLTGRGIWMLFRWVCILKDHSFFQQYNNHLHVLAIAISKLHSEGILFYLTTRMILQSEVRVTAQHLPLLTWAGVRTVYFNVLLLRTFAYATHSTLKPVPALPR